MGERLRGQRRGLEEAKDRGEDWRRRGEAERAEERIGGGGERLGGGRGWERDV